MDFIEQRREAVAHGAAAVAGTANALAGEAADATFVVEIVEMDGFASGLKRCGGEGFLSLLEGFVASPAESWDVAQREVLCRESAYFRSHAEPLDYPKAKREGIPGLGLDGVRASFGVTRASAIFWPWSWLGGMVIGPRYGQGPHN